MGLHFDKQKHVVCMFFSGVFLGFGLAQRPFQDVVWGAYGRFFQLWFHLLEVILKLVICVSIWQWVKKLISGTVPFLGWLNLIFVLFSFCLRLHMECSAYVLKGFKIMAAGCRLQSFYKDPTGGLFQTILTLTFPYLHHPKDLVLGVFNVFLVHETNKTTPFGGS